MTLIFWKAVYQLGLLLLEAAERRLPLIEPHGELKPPRTLMDDLRDNWGIR